MTKKNPCREKSGNLKFCWKSGKNQGISKKLIFVRSKYSNFIAVQMWLLVVSFCHMLKIPADLLKGGVLVCCIFCFFFFSFRSGHFIANPMSVIKLIKNIVTALCINMSLDSIWISIWLLKVGAIAIILRFLIRENQIKSGKNQGIWLLQMCGHPALIPYHTGPKI